LASKELLDLLNKGIARELGVSIQYMWQNVLWKGPKGFVVKDELRNIAINEMKHAELIAARLAYLGGMPTTKPDPVFVGDKVKEMLELDKKAEEEAIALYKQTIQTARKEDDITTARMFEQILQEEEEHHDTFTSLLEDI